MSNIPLPLGNCIERMPTDHRNSKPEETRSTVDFGSILGIKVHKILSMSQEAPPLAVG